MTDGRVAGTLKRLSPPWLTRTRGGAVMGAFADVLDDMLESTALGARARFPGTISTALPLLGRDRRIVRGPGESDANYAGRLLRWWDDHARRGGPYALLEQLRAFFAADPRQADLVYHSGTRYSLVTGRPTYAWFRSLPWHTLIVPDMGVTLEGGAVSQINDISGNGHHFVQATAASRPTVATGPHGKPELVFDGVDDFLLSSADVTLSTNYVVWCVARMLTLPSEVGQERYLWTQRDGSSSTEYLLITSINSFGPRVGGITTSVAASPALDKTAQEYALVAAAYPAGEFRRGNVASALATGTDSSPVTGTMTLGNFSLGTPNRPAHVEISAFGILDADDFPGLEATLAALHEYAAQTWLAPDPALDATNEIVRDAITWDPDGTALWAQAWLFYRLNAHPGVLTEEEIAAYRAIPDAWNAGHVLRIENVLIWPGADLWDYPPGVWDDPPGDTWPDGVRPEPVFVNNLSYSTDVSFGGESMTIGGAVVSITPE